MELEEKALEVLEAPVKLFKREMADARDGVETVFHHVMEITENELHKTRSYLESELATLRNEVAELKAKLAYFLE